MLDGAILATGAVVVWWAYVLGPVVAVSDPEPVAFAISIAYPIGDLLLIGLALGLLMTPGARSASFGLLVANLVALLVGDLVFGLQSTVAVDELFRRAGVAMYHAKAQGRNRLACYTPSLEPVATPVPDAAASEAMLVEPLTRRPLQPRPAPST